MGLPTYNVRVERSAGYAGIAFVIMALASTLLTWPPPRPSASAADIAAYLAAHHQGWRISTWLALPGVSFFLWFIVQLRAYLRRVPDEDDGLPTYMLTAGVVSSAFVLVVALVEAIMGARPLDEIAPSSLLLLWDFLNAGNAIFLMPVAVMLLAASQSAWRHRSMPRWAVYWGYVAALGCALGASSIFFWRGFLEIGGLGSLWVGGVPFAIWIIIASMTLIRGPKASAQAV